MISSVRSNRAFRTILLIVPGLLGGCALRDFTKHVAPENAASYLKHDTVVVLSTQCLKKYCSDQDLVWQPFDPETNQLEISKSAAPSNSRPSISKNTTLMLHHESSILRTVEYRKTYHVVDVRPGTYVLSRAHWTSNSTTHYNLGSLSFTAKPGELLYLGNYWIENKNDGGGLWAVWSTTVKHGTDLKGAQRFLQTKYPELEASKLKVADLNQVKINYPKGSVPAGVMWYVETE